jgi:hypothetical protein
VVEAVDCLTKRDGEPYEGRIERAASHPLARPVKLADLEDNMDLRRLPQLTEQDLQRLQRYHRGWKRLIGGNADCGINGFNSEEAKGLRKR